MIRKILSVVSLALVCLFTAVAGQAQILVATNSAWAWQKGSAEVSNPTTAWRSRVFDDSAWPRGDAPFYYDTENVYRGNTLLSDMRNGYTTIYLRKSFSVANASQIGSLQLTFFCDDGFALWLNGILVTNFNKAPSGSYAYNAVADRTATEPLQWFGYTIPNPQSYLLTGQNVIAVQGFNRPITSTDFILDLELRAVAKDSEAPRVATVLPAPGTVTTLSSITVTFTEPVQGLGFSDLLVNSNPAIDVTGSGATYTFTLPPLPEGPVQVSWDGGAQITDFADPGNRFDTASAGATWSYTLVDTTAPMVRVITPPPGNMVRSLSQIEVIFDEAVTGVDANDLRLNGVAALAVVGSEAGPYVFTFSEAQAGPAQLSWSADHGVTDKAAARNQFVPASWNYTVDPNFTYSPVRINEVLTGYSTEIGLTDEDDELNDWIELFNGGTTPVNLRGWSLSDDPDEPGKWVFPDVTIGAGQDLIVFASAKDRRPTTPGQRLHTNFKLNSAGEYLGLFNAEFPRRPVSEFTPELPEQRPNISFGYDRSDVLRYFAVPTPGVANGTSSITAVVPEVRYSVKRGFHDAPFDLVLSCDLADVQIRYTTNGSEPTATTGLLYSGAINISSNAIIRAAAYKANHLPSLVKTHTYIFPQHVIRQPNNPSGFPSTWIDTQNRTWTADYEMDPEIVNSLEYKDEILPALKALPVLSIVTKPEDMFDNANGIYPKSQARGVSWERPASAEFIFHDKGEDVQVNCGVQMQGNSVRDPVKTAKHAFRLVFKGDYGEEKLRYRIFPESPVEEFDTLTLRADFNNSWMHWDGAQRPRGQRVRDAFIKDTQRAMSGLSAHNRFFHLYVNGLYWGIYDPTERPDASFGVAYMGGRKEDYDVVNELTLVDGNMTAYNTLNGIGGLDNNANYQTLEQYLDVPNYIDYMLLHFYIGHQDWFPNKNWYMIRKRLPGEGFKYIAWDGELAMNSPTDNRVTSGQSPGRHVDLVANAQYRLDFADRVQKHMFNNGALTPANVAARYAKRASEVELAMVAESARWGDYRRDVHQYSSAPYELYTRNQHFNTERNRLLTQYFPGRTATVLNQLRGAGLYPATAAPTFNQNAGLVPNGFKLALSGPGTIYYTLDGSDPRVRYSGAIAPGARTYSTEVTLGSSVLVKARSRNGTEWSALTEAVFQVDSLAVPLVITELMYNPIGGSPYEFIELLNNGPIPLDLSGYSFEGVSFIFPPNSVLAPGQIIVLAASQSPTAFATRYPGVTVYGYFEDSLSNGGERIAIRDRELRTIASVTYRDNNGWPTAADGSGYSLELLDPANDPNAPSSWLPSAAAGGTPGSFNSSTPDPNVRLNEVMAANVAAVRNGDAFPDWVELHNPLATGADIGGWILSDVSSTRQFSLPSGTRIQAGGYLIVWCSADPATSGINTGFALDKNGETLFLFDAQTNRVGALTFGPQLSDFTLGYVDQAASWSLCIPTPGSANITAKLTTASNLIVNEWLADALPGESDWLELHNTDRARPAALKGLYLSTGTAIFQIRSSSFIQPGGFIRLDASEQGGASDLDFKLAAFGGYVALHDITGRELTRVTYSLQAQGVSEGRLPDGTTQVVRFPATPTPGHSNYLPLPGVIFNEVLPLSSAPFEDAIELHNSSALSASIGGFYISDDELNLKKFQLPADTLLAAGDYHVLYEADFAPGLSLSELGGELWLSEADSAGNLTGRRSGIGFGPAETNVSFGQFPTSLGSQFVLLSAPTFGVSEPVSVSDFRLGSGGLNATARIGPLAITEFMFHPVSGEPPLELAHEEYIELRNITGNPLTLYVSGTTKAWKVGGGIEFTFPSNLESVIHPNAFVLLVNFDPRTNTVALENFRRKYNAPTSASIFGPFQGRLSNLGEQLGLLKPADFSSSFVTIESLTYQAAAPWPVADGTGESLHRVVPLKFANDPISWVAGRPTPGWMDGEVEIPLTISTFVFSPTELTFSIRAAQNSGITLQGSQNLNDWQDLGSTNAPSTNFLWHIDLNAAQRNEFYRLRLNP